MIKPDEMPTVTVIAYFLKKWAVLYAMKKNISYMDEKYVE